MSQTSYNVSDWLNYMTHAEIDFLKSLAYGLPPDPLVVNIGAGGGTSGLAFMECRPDLRLVTIDITLESSPLGCLEAEQTVLKEAGLYDTSRWYQIHGDSVEVGINWDQPVDMVFVDGNHSYEGCTGDILNWMQHLRPGGVIAVHDYKKIDAYLKRQARAGIAVALGDDGLPPHDLIGRVIKPYPTVDQSVDDHLLPFYQHLATIDSLIAFRKQDKQAAHE